MGNKKSGKKAISIAMAAIMIASIFAMIAPAFGVRNVPVPSGKAGIFFLDPQHDVAEKNCTSRTIDVWVNSSGTIDGGSVVINTTDKTCANITSCLYNSTEWDQFGTNVIVGNGESARMTFGSTVQKNPGTYHVGTITVHCNSSIYCKVNLTFIPGRANTYITNASGLQANVAMENGTFTCCPPKIEVEKTVYDPDTKTWVEQIETGLDENVTFRGLIHAKCCNLTNVTVTDVLPGCMEYINGSAKVNGQP
ncbi:hypothetical protein CW713_08695, partial [Methanophagales archaeon]